MAWLSGYPKRKKVTLTGAASGGQTDYQMKLAVTYDSDMQADFDDLRFTKLDGTTLLDAWLESKTDSTSAVVWVETDTPANGVDADIYMYYGNAAAASCWDIDETFIFGDDFVAGDCGYSASRASGSSIGFNAVCPRIVVADNGDWLMVYRAKADGSAPSGHEGQVWIRNSTDDGETWSSGTKLSSDVYDAINAEFIKYPNGDIDIFYTRYDNSTSTFHTPNMVSRSTDDGATWGTFAACASPFDEYETMWQDITIGTEVYLATNRRNCSTGDYDCKFYKTTNNGSTWTHISNITTQAVDGTYVEPGTVYLGNGDFVTVLRSGSKVDTLQKRSTDWGATWTTDGYIKNDGSVAASGVGTDVALHQCRIFNEDINGNDLGYVYMQAALYPGSYPRDMYAYISTDNCASWGTVDPIYTASDCHDSAIVFKSDTSAKYYPGKTSAESATTDDDITISGSSVPLASKWDVLNTGVTLSTDQAFMGSKSAKFVASGGLEKTLVHSNDIAIKYWAYFPSQPDDFYVLLHGDGTSRLYAFSGYPSAGDISYHDGAWQDTGVNTVTGAWKSFEARNFDWTAHTQDILYDENVIAADAGQRAGTTYNDTFRLLASSSCPDFYIDCFIVRKYVANPATYAFGSEEVKPITYTSDALFKKLGLAETYTSDALFKKLGLTTTYSADSLLKVQNLLKSYTSDLLIKLTDGDITYSADALLELDGITKAYSSDLLIAVRNTKAYTTDALLKALGLSTSYTADALLKLIEESKTYTADSLIKKVDSGIPYTSDALLKKEDVSVAYTTDLLIQHIDNILSYTADLIIQLVETRTYTADALLKKLNNVSSYTADLIISSSGTVSYSADTLLKLNNITKAYTADLLIMVRNALAYTADTLLKKTDISTGYSSDALVKRLGLTTTYTADSLLQKTDLSKTYSSDLLIALRQSKTYTADALLKVLSNSTTYSSDLLIQHIDEILSYTADALFKITETNAYTSDALLKKLNSVNSYTADLIINSAGIVSYTTDMLIQVNDVTKAYTADLLIMARNVASYTSDALIKKLGAIVGYSADALLQKQNITTAYTSDALLQKAFTSTYTSDALIQKAFTAAYTTDAILKKEGIAILYTADALLKKAVSLSYSADVIITSLAIGSRTYTADLLIDVVSAEYPAKVFFIRKSGTPQTGLTPTIDCYNKVVDGSSGGTSPMVRELGCGYYKFHYNITEDIVVTIDTGDATMTDEERYLNTVLEITKYDATYTLLKQHDAKITGLLM